MTRATSVRAKFNNKGSPVPSTLSIEQFRSVAVAIECLCGGWMAGSVGHEDFREAYTGLFAERFFYHDDLRYEERMLPGDADASDVAERLVRTDERMEVLQRTAERILMAIEYMDHPDVGDGPHARLSIYEGTQNPEELAQWFGRPAPEV